MAHIHASAGAENKAYVMNKAILKSFGEGDDATPVCSASQYCVKGKFYLIFFLYCISNLYI